MKLVLSTSRAALAVLLFTAAAHAATITYSTNAPGTGFGGTSLVLNNSSGEASTLTFAPNVNSISGVPSNVNFGVFTLVCTTCTTQAIGSGANYGSFAFNLVLTDVTDGNATGQFVGTSTGGAVFSDVSQITINWAPLVLGPGTVNALTGNFGNSIFGTTVFTGIVAPNSGQGQPNGVTTVEGYVNSSAVPEPATVGVVGIALLGLGLIRRRATSSK